MKHRVLAMIAGVILCAILMSACQAATTGATNGTKPSLQTTNSTTTVPTTTVPTTTVPTTTVPTTTVPTTTAYVTQPTTVSPETAELLFFNDLFMNNTDPERNSYYWATGCVYSSPAEIKLKAFLDGGFSAESAVTDAEKEALGKLGLAPETFLYEDVYRLPKDRIDQELMKVFGITLVELPQSAFEGLYYLESTDCYYLIQSGMTSVPMHSQFQTVEHNDDGTVTLSYELPGGSGSITLKSNGDGWLAVSNTQNTSFG